MPMVVEQCSITDKDRVLVGSAGIDASGSLDLLETVEIVDTGPLALSAAGTLMVNMMNISARNAYEAFEVAAGNLTVQEPLDCGRLVGCSFRADSLPPMSDIQCSETSGRFYGNGSLSCKRRG